MTQLVGVEPTGFDGNPSFAETLPSPHLRVVGSTPSRIFAPLTPRDVSGDGFRMMISKFSFQKGYVDEAVVIVDGHQNHGFRRGHSVPGFEGDIIVFVDWRTPEVAFIHVNDGRIYIASLPPP